MKFIEEKKYIFLICLFLIPFYFSQAQEYSEPLHIPNELSGTNLDLTIQEGTHTFSNGVTSPTLGYNGSFLGPTLFFNQHDSVFIAATNNMSNSTTIHWHGMEVPAIADGGPKTVIEVGETWRPKFEVREKASTLWYHSHLHSKSRAQINAGLAGMIIVRDTASIHNELPNNYGIDDIPIMLMDKTFAADTINHDAFLGDHILVNGTLNGFIELPKQVVRLRLLNASIKRNYNIGLSDNSDFSIIASDGGLLENPVLANRILVTAGERFEILLDLTSATESDSIFLVNYSSEMPYGLEGGVPGVDTYPSPLNGVDTSFLKIIVGPETTNSITTIPNSLSVVNQPDTSGFIVKRLKTLDGKAQPGSNEITWTINQRAFDMAVVNDIIMAGSTEIWTIHNKTHIAHPFHIHAGQFYILDRDSSAIPMQETGAKDVVMVFPNEKVKFSMKFPNFVDESTTYMYHCHMLDHQEKAMMGQFLLVDSSYFVNSIQSPDFLNNVSLYPNPSSSFISVKGLDENQMYFKGTIYNLLGEVVLSIEDNFEKIDISRLDVGNYYLKIQDQNNNFKTLSFIKME